MIEPFLTGPVSWSVTTSDEANRISLSPHPPSPEGGLRRTRAGRGGASIADSIQGHHALIISVARRGRLRRGGGRRIDRAVGGGARGFRGPDLGQQNRDRARQRLGLLEVGIHRNGLHLGILAEGA